MGTRNDGDLWLSMPLVVATLGCGPGGPAPLDSGLDETGGDDGSGGSGSEGDGTDDGVGSDGVAPQLLSAWTDETGKYIVLHFSEPMAPPDEVDPTHFRISYAKTVTQYVDDYYIHEQVSNTWYHDPQYYLYHQQYDMDGPMSVITSVTIGEPATDLVLELAEPMRPYVCDILEVDQGYIDSLKQQGPTNDGLVGLYPHYARGWPEIRSAQDEALGSIGKDWVLLDNFYLFIQEQFGFPDLSPAIPIDCRIGQ